MATLSQIRGMLLEEALLYLLRIAGYKTVETRGTDPSLSTGRAGIEIKGRGANHQIDAIADSLVSHPFSHPQRLLIEAKCYSPNKRVGLEVIRNAVGVLKDVSEYWIPSPSGIQKQRYHYQYAVFSATDYSKEAQKYAFAQDVYLIPLANSRNFKPIINSIRSLEAIDFNAGDWRSIDINLTDLRKETRKSLKNYYHSFENSGLNDPARWKIIDFCDSCKRINGSLLGVISGQFPIFLTPSSRESAYNLPDVIPVEIHWNEDSWFLESREHNIKFSFDLPLELFNQYATNGILTAPKALGLKSEQLTALPAILYLEERIRIIRFEMDYEWFNRVKSRIEISEETHGGH